MRIDRLKLTNYRKFKELTIDFDENMTILVGQNSSGKTTILDALKVAFWPYISGYDLGSTTNTVSSIQISDVRLERSISGNMDYKLNSSIEAFSNIFGIEKWMRYRESIKKGTTTKENNNSKKLKIEGKKHEKNISDKEILNPLLLNKYPNLFDLDKKNGALKANDKNCEDLVIESNIYNNTKELVEKTIELLNLNCDRLNSDRLEILKFYNQEISTARKVNNKNIFETLPNKWFFKRWSSFFTTRRILLGDNVEQYLKSVNYSG